MLQPQLHRASWKERLLSALYQHNVDTERMHEEAKDHAVCRTYLLKGFTPHMLYMLCFNTLCISAGAGVEGGPC